MTRLADHLDDYLATRHRLGFLVGNDAYTLRSFVRFCEHAELDTITTTAVVAWASEPRDVARSWIAKRFSVVRLFAKHVHAVDPSNELPPARMISGSAPRRVPYLYRPEEIDALIAAAGGLAGRLRPRTYQTLIGLLAVTGMRVGEAIALDVDDVDLHAGSITIRRAKFNKSRRVPIHASTAAALDAYLHAGEHPATTRTAVFVNDAGERINYPQAHLAFVRCLTAAGLDGVPRRRPRLHDLRHSFATTTLIGWYRDGADVEALMPYLSTYLGHTKPSATYWYLTAAPELAALVAGRLDLIEAAFR